METETFDLLALLQAFRDEQVYFHADGDENDVSVAICASAVGADDPEQDRNLDHRRGAVLTRVAG